MFNEYREIRADRKRKKELKSQLPSLLNSYPVARKNRDLTVAEKRAKMVLIGYITSMLTSYSAEYVAALLFDMADYDFNLAPSFEKACQDLGVTASSLNLNNVMYAANNSPIMHKVPDFITEYAKVSNA